MNLKHKVNVNIQNSRGERQKVLSSTRMSLPRRLIKLLFGDFCDVLVLTPGANVKSVEISEIKESKEAING
ncbi:MAG: hypothetical protein WCR70_05505 [Sphaerochaetaceae bacterium]|jgi:hypothetical protein|nr:hypothetical protein [Candidatus Cloacimonadota bacterium]